MPPIHAFGENNRSFLLSRFTTAERKLHIKVSLDEGLYLKPKEGI
jgi:hypothetical protein